MATSLLSLASVGARSVATVAACAGVGAYARRTGVLSDEVQKGVERLISEIFLPCLIFQKVVPNMNAEELISVWPLLVVCICTVVYGLFFGALVGSFAPKYRGLIMTAVAFPNSFSVPLTLMLMLADQPVLVENVPEAEGSSDVKERINLKFCMSYTLWVLARWSIGYPMVSGALTFRKWCDKALNAAVLACLVGIALGSCWDLVPRENQSAIVASRWLEPLSTSLDYMGRCNVPAMLLTLGAKLSDAAADLAPSRGWTGGAKAPLLPPQASPAAQQQALPQEAKAVAGTYLRGSPGLRPAAGALRRDRSSGVAGWHAPDGWASYDQRGSDVRAQRDRREGNGKAPVVDLHGVRRDVDRVHRLLPALALKARPCDEWNLLKLELLVRRSP